MVLPWDPQRVVAIGPASCLRGSRLLLKFFWCQPAGGKSWQPCKLHIMASQKVFDKTVEGFVPVTSKTVQIPYCDFEFWKDSSQTSQKSYSEYIFKLCTEIGIRYRFSGSRNLSPNFYDGH